MRACSTGVFGSCLLLCARTTIGADRGGGEKTARSPLNANMRAGRRLLTAQIRDLPSQPGIAARVPARKKPIVWFDVDHTDLVKPFKIA